MAHPVTVESKKLEQACGLVDSFANRHKDPSRARLSLLEAVACRYSGMPVDVYRTTTGYDDGIDVDEGYVDGSSRLSIHAGYLQQWRSPHLRASRRAK